jgi:hypothetical protein
LTRTPLLSDGDSALFGRCRKLVLRLLDVVANVTDEEASH